MADSEYVLLVDDDPVMNFLSKRMLESFRFTADVEMASDGVEALEVIERRGTPCWTLLDIRMPRMDGFEFLNHLREQGLEGGHNVVIMSSSTRPEDKETAAAFDCVLAYIEKPLSREGMSELLREHECLRACFPGEEENTAG